MFKAKSKATNGKTTDEILLQRKVDQRDRCTHFAAASRMKVVFFFFEQLLSRPSRIWDYVFETRKQVIVVLLQRWARNKVGPVQCSICTSVKKRANTATSMHIIEDIVIKWWKGDSSHVVTLFSFPSSKTLFSVAKCRLPCSLCFL